MIFVIEIFFILEVILLILTPLAIILLLLVFFSPSSVKASFMGAPFLPTSKKIIRLALMSANLRPEENLYDLGSGTGRVLIIGAKEFGANVVGVEYSTPLFVLSKINLFLHKIKNRKIYKEDFFESNIKLNKADVVYLFLTPKAFPKLKEKFEKELKSGTRIITFSSPLLFWQPKEVIPLAENKNRSSLYLYVKD